MNKKKKVLIKRLAIGVFLAVFGLLSVKTQAQNLKFICSDLNKEPCVQTRKMIVAAQVIALGEEPKGDDWTYAAEGMLSGFCSDKIYEQKIKDGLKLSDAVNFWKCYLASDFTGDGTRMKVTQRAYFEVYGAYPVIEQNNYWIGQMKQKKAWYSQIVSTEQGKLYSDSELRKKTISRVYAVSMGRSAEQKEIDYWMARKNDFRQMYHAARNYLYSKTPEAENDLYYTVRRALTVLTAKNPSKEEILAAIEKYRPKKMLHSEIIGKTTDYGF